MSVTKGTVITGESTKNITAVCGETLLSALRAAGIPVNAPCGGNGTCGKCRVIAFGALSPMDETEREHLSDDEMKRGVRLACRSRVLGDFTVRTDCHGEIDVETDFRAAGYDILPMVEARRTTDSVSFWMDGACIDTAPPDAANLGLAVDIGTTTVAVYLCDLDAGCVVGKCGFRNPQTAYGADVISRIDKIMKDSAALAAQQRLVIDAVNAAAQALCRENGSSFADVRAAVVCGNTIMQHIAAGIDPSSIANAPFVAPTLFGTTYRAREVGLLENENALVYFAPCFASYVGGDIACGMIATGLDRRDRLGALENIVFLDVGTNGEIGLSTGNGLYFCSAAAGPAFEGAHIECGMAGTPGAICEVFLDGGKLSYRTIGGEEPCGICGSGILDAAAAMLDMGLLDETGRIVDMDEAGEYADYLDEVDGHTRFVIDREHDIYIGGKDIREIQLAKAAICAGIYTLLRKAGLAVEDVSSVVLAGGFGSHISPRSACRIGLIPRAWEDRVTAVGNTAGAGAASILLGGEPRESARTICGKADYIELSGDAFFMEKYVEKMMFE